MAKKNEEDICRPTINWVVKQIIEEMYRPSLMDLFNKCRDKETRHARDT